MSKAVEEITYETVVPINHCATHANATPSYIFNAWDASDADADGLLDYKSDFTLLYKMRLVGIIDKPTVYDPVGGSEKLGSVEFQHKGTVSTLQYKYKPAAIRIHLERRSDGRCWSHWEAFALDAAGNPTGPDLLIPFWGNNRFFPAYYTDLFLAPAPPA